MTVAFYDVGRAQADAAGAIEAAVSRVLRSGWFVLGPEVEAFESEWAMYCEAGHAVGVGSGLDALKLVLEALGIGPGDEVIVPGQTFIATWLAVSAVGATPVPVDVDAATGLIEPEAVNAAITPRSVAIVAVDLFGQPADLTGLAAIARRHGLALVEDAAQAHGARHRGRRVGAGPATAAAFSFYPGKNLGALGDGGAVVTDDAGLASRIRRLRNYGSTRKYVHDEIGGNSRLDELQAAVLRAKLGYLDTWNDRRAAAAARYDIGLAGIDVQRPTIVAGNESAWHLYVIGVGERDALRQRLADAGIETSVHYPTTPGRSGAYREQFGALPLPGADALARRALSLPLSPAWDDEELARVIAALSELVGPVRHAA